MASDDDRTERIRRRAYELWEQAGRPAGRDAEHWDQAEREVLAEDERTGVDVPRDEMTGVMGHGSSAEGRPGADVPGHEVPISAKDKRRGIKKQHTVSTIPNTGAARDARNPGSGAGGSEMFAKDGSGSTTNAPDAVPGYTQDTGDVSGSFGTGVGGPAAPTGSPIADAGVKGAGARSRRTKKKDETSTAPQDEQRPAAKRTRRRS